MKYTLENIAGVDCIFAPMEDANSVTIEIMCKAWSIYENKKNNGISHFLEHLFFKWGKNYPTPMDVAVALDKIGGEFNAYTWDEHAGYYVKCAPEFFAQALDVLGDMMIHPAFPKDELEREKWVVIQELKMYEDNPMAMAMEKRQRYFYGDTSYGRSTIGTQENILSFTQEMLFEHKADLYSKDNMVITIAGKFVNIDTMKAQLTKLFEALPEKKRINKPEFLHALPTEKIDFYDKKTEQNHLVISAMGFDGNDERRYAASVLATILGWNMSSRLFQNIREKEGLCYYIKAMHMSEFEHGVFIIRAWMDKARFDFGIERIFQEIEKIANGDFTEEEFKNALGYTEGQIQMGIEGSDEMASFLGTQKLIYNKVDTLDEILAKYKKLTRKDVQDVASTLKKENLYMYYIK